MCEDRCVAESAVVSRVAGGNNANSTSDSGRGSGFFLPCVESLDLKLLPVFFSVEDGSPGSPLLLSKSLSLF